MRAAIVILALLLSSCDDRGSRPTPSWPTPNAGAPASTRLASTQAEPSGSSGSPACGKSGAPTGVLARHVSVFGKQRRYTLVVPASYTPAKSYPIVYVLHGHGGSGAQVRRAFDLEQIAQGGAIFLYPDGIGGGWDLDSPASKNRDVALFDATLAITQSDYCVDLSRVFVAGFSNGAYMANQLGCRRGDRIRAVASHSGGGPYENAGEYDERGHLVCKGKPVASLVIHGAADASVAPSEGQKSIDHWTYANRCSSRAPTSPQGCVAYQGCVNQVVACTVAGLGHGLWPQAKQLIWNFFEAQR
jgi:polyhydroxybutyrate depolymerase